MKSCLLMVIVALLSACSLPGGTIPADHFYRLPVAEPVALKAAVDIKSVQADGLYNERALLFVESARPLELQRYSYHFWALTPAKMLQQYLQGCLQSSETVLISDTKQLTPVIEAFERVLNNGQPQTVIKLRINQRHYEAIVTATSMDMHATVVAYGQAMQKICEAVAQDF